MWPWAEDNQGLLSLGALAAALLLALLEHLRANRADRRRHTEFIDMVLELLDAAVASAVREGVAAEALAGTGDGALTQVAAWNIVRSRVLDSLGVIRPSAPRDAVLALELAKAVSTLTLDRAFMGVDAGASADRFRQIARTLSDIRRAVRGRRTTFLLQRLLRPKGLWKFRAGSIIAPSPKDGRGS